MTFAATAFTLTKLSVFSVLSTRSPACLSPDCRPARAFGLHLQTPEEACFREALRFIDRKQ